MAPAPNPAAEALAAGTAGDVPAPDPAAGELANGTAAEALSAGAAAVETTLVPAGSDAVLPAVVGASLAAAGGAPGGFVDARLAGPATDTEAPPGEKAAAGDSSG